MGGISLCPHRRRGLNPAENYGSGALVLRRLLRNVSDADPVLGRPSDPAKEILIANQKAPEKRSGAFFSVLWAVLVTPFTELLLVLLLYCNYLYCRLVFLLTDFPEDRDFFFKSLLNLLQYCFSFIFWVFWSQIM